MATQILILLLKYRGPSNAGVWKRRNSTPGTSEVNGSDFSDQQANLPQRRSLLLCGYPGCAVNRKESQGRKSATARRKFTTEAGEVREQWRTQYNLSSRRGRGVDRSDRPGGIIEWTDEYAEMGTFHRNRERVYDD